MLPIFISAISNAEDRSLAETLYSEHKDKVYKTAYKILNNAQEAEEITTDVFIKVIDRIEDYHDRNADELAGLFVTIAKNLSFNRYKRNTKIEFVPMSDDDSGEAYFDSVSDFIVTKELHEKLYKAVDSLDEEYSRIVKLKMSYDYSDKKIAEMLDISDGNVRIRYHRAKKLLYEFLKGDI